MKLLDLLFERSTRRLADTTSRRKLLARMGSLMVAGAALPLLLPLDRTSKALAADNPKAGDPGDPNSCDYWRYCSIDGFLCSCCGLLPTGHRGVPGDLDRHLPQPGGWQGLHHFL